MYVGERETVTRGPSGWYKRFARCLRSHFFPIVEDMLCFPASPEVMLCLLKCAWLKECGWL